MMFKNCLETVKINHNLEMLPNDVTYTLNGRYPFLHISIQYNWIFINVLLVTHGTCGNHGNTKQCSAVLGPSTIPKYTGYIVLCYKFFPWLS